MGVREYCEWMRLVCTRKQIPIIYVKGCFIKIDFRHEAGLGLWLHQNKSLNKILKVQMDFTK